MKYAKRFLIFSFIISSLVSAGFGNALAVDCEVMPSGSSDEVSKKIECLKGKVGELSKQANTLKNQIAQFNAQISLTQLKITETQDKINLLGGRIDTLETSLTNLTDAFSARALTTYMMARGSEPVFLLLSADDVGDVISKFHYLAKIQTADYDLLIRLQTAQNSYKVSKQETEALQKELEKQKITLNSQKQAKAQLLTVTQSDEAKYQQLLSQAKAQLSAFSKFVSAQGGATILTNQTVCDNWGCYYNQRDSSWGNMGIGNSDSSMANYGCLVTSVGMIATHYGKGTKPSDIAGATSPFFASTAYMLFSWSGVGISVTRSSIGVSEGSIDGELSAGRPVIAGLYGSSSNPEHFIVIKGKDGGGYIMYDPFLKDGGKAVVHLTDKYSFSNIVRVDRVSIN